MYDLARFGLKEMTSCGSVLRTIGSGARSMEEVAERVVQYVYSNLIFEDTGEKACVLVRLFKTHAYEKLEEDLQQFALNLLEGEQPGPGLKCFTLLATAGMQSEWNSRQLSIKHKAFPMVDAVVIEKIPMLSQQMIQFGIDPNMIVKPDPPVVIDMDQTTFNVFYVKEAKASPYIPHQQDFVIPFGVQSALALGGMFPSGDFFILVFFTKIVLPRATAEMFKPLALSIKAALLPFDGNAVFKSSTLVRNASGQAGSLEGEVPRLRSQLHAVNQLLEVHEQAVLERTEQLEQAITELEQFAYVASHDLQEPLRAISGYLDLLSKQYAEKLDDKARDFIGHAKEGALRMNALIRDLLHYARVDTRGKEFIPTDCNEVVEAALSNLSVAIEETGAEISSADLPRVLADSIQVAQVFQNLIGNSIKFRTEGVTPRIEITVSSGESEHTFAVKDNGIGFDMAHADRIFVIFKRLHTRTAYPGTGIGLSVCKKIIERHGGRIWVDSQPGTGTTFFFTMPLL